MDAEHNLSGKKIRLILTNNFHYSGCVISDGDLFLIITDKFGKEVRISKKSILSLEVMENEY